MRDSTAAFPTPILFLVFNRPDTTAEVFKEIRKVRPSRLYVAADGARKDKFGEAEKIAKVREIATAVDWPCELFTLFRDKNVGCKYAVSGAISWFFAEEEAGVIIEDDCLPSQDFFWFCNQMLNDYRDNQNIFSIVGTNLLPISEKNISYYYSDHTLPWGWASWARAWDKYDLELKSWPKSKQVKHMKSLNVGDYLFNFHFAKVLNKVSRGEIDTWDYQWIYTCWLNNGLTIVPVKNLISNIGFSDEATHTTVYHPILSNLKLNNLLWPLKKPSYYGPNLEANAFISRYWFGVSLKAFLKDRILDIPGFNKLNYLKSRIFEKIN
jgi:hypothetical protein